MKKLILLSLMILSITFAKSQCLTAPEVLSTGWPTTYTLSGEISNPCAVVAIRRTSGLSAYNPVTTLYDYCKIQIIIKNSSGADVVNTQLASRDYNAYPLAPGPYTVQGTYIDTSGIKQFTNMVYIIVPSPTPTSSPIVSPTVNPSTKPKGKK